jgi:hypothetical protein
VDMQNSVIANAHTRDAVVAKVAALVDRARRGQVPVPNRWWRSTTVTPSKPPSSRTCCRHCDVTVVGDAHTTEDRSSWGAPSPDKVIAHTNLYWTHQNAPGRTAGVVEAQGVAFGS